MKINLIPEVKQEQQKLHKLNTTVTTAATFTGFIVLGVILTLALYNIFKTTQLSMVKKDIEKINQELEAYKDLEQTVATLENGLADIKQIFSGEAKWSKFFAELEKATPADIQFTSLSVNGETITVAMKGESVQSIDRFIKSFSEYKVNDQNLFNSVTVTGYTSDKGAVTFNATMNLVGGVLW
jgi:Tfp pilus assembly protein PilN